jgi:hypothetical protein
MATQGVASNVQVRIYFEGRLVENAGTSFIAEDNVGAPATAQINCTPTNSIRHILPGTWVHIFTTDPWDLQPKGDLSDFKLVFEGVVVGRGWSKQSGGRAFQVHCADPSVYWVEARQFWLNITNAGGGIVDELAVQTSGGYGRFTMLESTGTYGYAISKLQDVFGDAEERFLDTMVSVLDDVGNVNPFYTNARNRFRLTDRIVRGPAGATDKLFQLSLLGDFLNGLAQRASGQTNLAEMVNMLLSSIQHEWVSILAPPLIKTRIFSRDAFGNIKRTKTTVERTDTQGTRQVDLFAFETAIDEVVANIIFKPQIYSLSPPTCNVLFPNMYDMQGFQESFLGEPTRLAMRPHLITRQLESENTFGLLFLRPTELEIFTALTRDPDVQARAKRSPDARFGDGQSQAPSYNDYDWATNEERIRGIVYNFVNMAPAPSTLTLADPGRRTPAGAREGGIPKYLQNVASYEYFKSKFASRQSSLSGPYNLRPVTGFPLLALDDSPANMNITAYLVGKTLSVDAQGSGRTEYRLAYPRLVDEVDYNRPRFKGGAQSTGELDLDLLRDADGNYQFDKIFDGHLKPPVPEWFASEFSTLTGLDITYQSWFGSRVLESILFADPTKSVSKAPTTAVIGGIIPGALANASEILGNNEAIDIVDAVTEINNRNRTARETGREFEFAASFTDRLFTRIDEAFRFVGAKPLEKQNIPASQRVIDYATDRLATFVGDASPGSGYGGVRESNQRTASTVTTTDIDGTVDAVSGAATIGTTSALPVASTMSGAFPVFDTKIHVGDEATNDAKRSALLATEAAPSTLARYDGRPLMFDFEFRLWQESLKAAGYSPDSAKIAENATQAAYIAAQGAVRAATPAEQAAAAVARQTQLATAAAAELLLKQAGASAVQNRTLTNDEQAPTGDGLEGNKKLPLPQPLSEKQVVDLRRAIIDAYLKELQQSRGFVG